MGKSILEIWLVKVLLVGVGGYIGNLIVPDALPKQAASLYPAIGAVTGLAMGLLFTLLWNLHRR